LPTNNFCGHGFWQFSPELFFSLYSKSNGYAQTEVFIADLSNTKQWYHVGRPSNGQRVEALSSRPLYVLVRTVLEQKGFDHDNVQQSDYAFEWAEPTKDNYSNNSSKSNIKERIKKLSMLYKLLSPVWHLYLRATMNDEYQRNPDLSPIKICDYLG